MPSGPTGGLTARQRLIKRGLDVSAAAVGLLVLAPVLVVAWVAATVDTRANGLFRQQRVGRHGRRFQVVKLRTMRDVPGIVSTVTTRTDPRITRLGSLLRRTKLDELPQLWNVLVGHMSLVGPRPDVPGYADRLEGRDRVVLTIRPGITGPATLCFRDEEALLAAAPDAQAYNDRVLYPAKVCLNRRYVECWRLADDLRYLWATLTGTTVAIVGLDDCVPASLRRGSR